MNSGPYITSDTIVALATPAGHGALALIRLSGPEAISIVNLFFKGKDLNKQPSHTIHFGTIREGEEVLDEVLVSLFIAPNSYTKENMVEISTHGSMYIVKAMMEIFVRHGARLANPGEFTLRAFLNGRMDLSQAEAVADLIASSSKASHRVSLQQMRGGVSKALNVLREKLIDLASLLELELDFSEEDVEFADRFELKTITLEICTHIKSLIDSFTLGNAIKEGFNIVIAGRPNAGKSTLLNALLNEERALVSDIAGTTRDTIEEVIKIHGVSFRFIDTAGIRQAGGVEAMGVQKTLEKIHQSAVVVYLFDAAKLRTEEVNEDIHKLCANMERHTLWVIVANKVDLINEKNIHANAFPRWTKFLTISAQQKFHIEELKQLLYEVVIGEKLDLGQPLLSNIRHIEALQKAQASLEHALNGLESQRASDLLAIDIKQALHYLGEVTGSVTSDDLLGNIFSKFCIGK